MAKQYFTGNSTSFSDVNSFLDKFDSEGKVLTEYKTAEIPEWISTGSYILNAAISGSLRKGIAAGRVITISGDEKVGKSYVIIDAIREAQKLGYFCIMFDTENSADSSRFAAQGVDPSKVRVKVPETVNEITVMLAQLTESLLDTQKQNEIKNKKLPPEQHLVLPKFAIFIDSLTTLVSSKQMNDALDGEIKMDMGTVAKELKLMFNLITPRIGKLGIPMVCTSHIYTREEGYQKVRTQSGGKGISYMSSVIVDMRKRFEKDENRVKKGIIVRAEIQESRFSVHRPIEFYISFTKGVNPYVGLHQYVSWDVCGITKGKMVQYADTLYELFRTNTKEEILGKRFSTFAVKNSLSIPKKEAFKVSFEKDIEDGYIKLSSGESTISLPDLPLYIQSKGHNLNLEFEFEFLKECMTLDGIYSDDAAIKMLSSALENDLYVIGNGKLDVTRNQKFKYKKPLVTAIENNTYVGEELVLEVASEKGVYNEKIEQQFVFTDKAKERFMGNKVEMIVQEICMPNATSPDWVVRHLNAVVKDANLFSSKVFTPEVIAQIDEKIIIPAFSYRKTYENIDGNYSEDEVNEISSEEAVQSFNIDDYVAK